MHKTAGQTGATVSVAPSIQTTARTAAVCVADAAMNVFTQGRWTPTVVGEQAYMLATQILVIEADMGPVCDAAYAEPRIMHMAQAAHMLVQIARAEGSVGNARISPSADAWLVDCGVDEMLVPAYAIVATRI